MSVFLWPVKAEKSTAFFGITESEFFHLTFTGMLDSGRKKAKQAAESLAAGNDLQGVISETGAKSLVAPLSEIQTLSAQGHSDTIKITYLPHGTEKTKSHSFSVANQQTSNEIIQSLQSAIGRPGETREESVSFLEAVTGPAIITVVAGLLSFALIATSRELAAGHQIEITGRKPGIKRLLVGIAETLGETGSLVVGGLVVVGCLGFLIMRITKRPSQSIIVFSETT